MLRIGILRIIGIYAMMLMINLNLFLGYCWVLAVPSRNPAYDPFLDSL